MTTATTEPTCAERILENLKDREAEIKALFDNADSDDYHDDPALSIDTKQVTTVCLSYGGPSDYLEITHDGADIEKVIYRFSDWFDTATLPVTDGPLYYYAENIIEGLNS